METHPKLRRVSTMFATSCNSHTLSDVINNTVLLSRPFPSIRRQSTAPTDTSSPHEPPPPVTIADILNGRLCPSAAPPSTPPRHLLHQNTQNRRISKKVLDIPASTEDDEIRETEYEEDEEEETDTMFSSRSFSSDSSAGSRRRTVAQPRRVEIKDSFAVVKKSSDPYGDFRRSSKKVLEIPASTDDEEIRETEYEEDEEEETDTMFSSRSFSSDSSAGFRRRTVAQPPRVEMKDSFAVVKKSSDPYGDFRRSMVEMIVEKEMFGEEDLEGLLQCFLSLNSPHHHRVIVEVFTEIWEAMFSHWS